MIVVNMALDSLQRRLKQMEEENPSANYHPRTVLKSFFDWLYFIKRAMNKSVTEYTEEQRIEDRIVKIVDDTMPCLRYLALWRIGSQINRNYR